ncbi:trypsin CFT-1-like [Anticarsia gemmatalis]|uniref:trypsin CFT-1-like n=1 Tax=Anticarsia gemmatalis TaxID=129554 RepID=UPI003F769623
MRAIVLLALVGTAFAVPQKINRIVGGSDTTVETYPYMANMQYGFFGSWFSQACGGSLINAVSVLSAAHCFDGDPASWWRVRLGTSLRSSGGDIHSVARIIMHEQYNPPNKPLDADVAIIRLSTPAVFSNSIGVARIAGPNYQLPDGTSITAIGWGTTSSGGLPSEQLQHVDIDTVNQDLCAERYAYLKTLPGYDRWPDITDGMLCAGILNVGGKDACQGDSGGPVAHNGDIVVGVTSWGFGCGDAFYPGVLARVSYYSNWIVANA